MRHGTNPAACDGHDRYDPANQDDKGIVMKRRALLVRTFLIASMMAGFLVCGGCIKPKITLFPEIRNPEGVYPAGEGREKILLIAITGFISDSHRELSLSRRSSMVQEIVSQLKKAEKDKDIKGVILKIDSPGGSVTASDMLYHEIVRYKERSGVKLTAVMMGTAASGDTTLPFPPISS